jgi:hypothetical protein
VLKPNNPRISPDPVVEQQSAGRLSDGGPPRKNPDKNNDNPDQEAPHPAHIPDCAQPITEREILTNPIPDVVTKPINGRATLCKQHPGP